MENKLLTSIFYADDDVDDLDFFEEVTNEINKPASLFEGGEQMLDALHNPPPNASVIFLDLNMPLKSGFDILKEIKATPKISDIPVVILTTSVSTDDISQCKQLGAKLYIRKPTSVGDLRKAINHVLTIDWKNFIPTDQNFFYRPL
jgi:CheY-like chemotaxis protein